MKHLVRQWPALLTTALLSACAAHQVPFNEADFARYGGSGTGTVDGQAFRVTADNSRSVQDHHSTVKLIPANAYTDEIVQRKYANRVRLAHPDSRFAKYVRRVRADDNGHFVFRNVPAGEYYVACHAKWSYVGDGTDPDGNPEQVEYGADQWLYVRTAVKSGKTTTVLGWDQGN
jgi:hypothetical protein